MLCLLMQKLMVSEDKIQFIRRLAGDRRRAIRNIQIGVGDGSEDIFRVPILTVEQQDDGNPDLTISYFDPDTSDYQDANILDFDFDSGDVQVSPSPTEGQVVIAYFSYVTFTDAEISYILGRSEISNCPYLCAAMMIQAILADTSRFVSFTQGDAKYSFDEVSKRLERQVERLWQQSPVTADVISVPFNPDILSRIDWEQPPIVKLSTPFARF